MLELDTESAYKQNLSEVSESRQVLATENVLNAHGQLVVPDGAVITKNIFLKIIKFKLAKPIETSIALEAEFTGETLCDAIYAYIDSDDSMTELAGRFPIRPAITACCRALCEFYILRQKLTVLAVQDPDVFERSIFTAWIGCVILTQMGKSKVEIKDFFIAAMCHDLGMLHIKRDIIKKEMELTREEWRQLKCHPVIGFNICKAVRGLPNAVGIAVLEHHEELDGTGYPKGKISNQISFSARLINLLATVYQIYIKYFRGNKYTLKDVIPILQMNIKSRYGQMANQLIVILRELEDHQYCSLPKPLVPEFVESIKERKKYIDDTTQLAEEISQFLGYTHKDPTVITIQNSIIHITMSIVQSGIINDAYMRWLDQVVEETLDFAHQEVEMVFVMMGEVIYHIKRLHYQIEDGIEKVGDENIVKFLSLKLDQLKSLKLKPIDNSLAHLWAVKFS